MKRKRNVVFQFVGLLLFASYATHACQCEMPSCNEAYDKASSVFLGKVYNIVHEYGPKDAVLSSLVTFEVEISFKGYYTNRLNVTASPLLADCPGHRFYPGEAFLVYATGTSDLFVDTVCTHRVLERSAASNDINRLHRKCEPYQGNNGAQHEP